VLDQEGSTQQILTLPGSAWNQRGPALTELVRFMDPPSDATGRLFLRSPVDDGFTATQLVPAPTGYFELADLYDVPLHVSASYAEDPGVEVEWGELDEDGNYTLLVDGTPTLWNGLTYVPE
jgi:hypothetical protein